MFWDYMGWVRVLKKERKGGKRVEREREREDDSSSSM